MTFTRFIAVTTFAIAVLAFTSAHAQDAPQSASTKQQVQKSETKGSVFDMALNTSADNTADTDTLNTTHPILNLTPDKSQMVKLFAPAASVLVGNPNHVNVMLDTPDTLVVIPRAQGASYFTVIGKDGSILMQRHVIVGVTAQNEEKQNYVRIRRSCGNSTSGRPCAPTSVYFCPDSCHEVSLNEGAQRRR